MMANSGRTEPEAGQGSVVLRLRPDTFEWGSTDDDRWRADLADLEYDLRRELRDEIVDSEPGSGIRGAEITEVILALGSAGAVTATVELIKAWISARPGRRKVRVEVDTTVTGKREVLVEADGLGATEIQELAGKGLGVNMAGGQQGE